MHTVYRRLHIVAFALLFLPLPTWGAVEDKDPIKAELDSARKAYVDTLATAKATLLKTFDDELKKIAATGDLDGYKAMQVDREKAMRGINLPESHATRKHQALTMQVAIAATKLLAEALDAGVKKYTMNLEIKKATAVQNEWKELLEILRQSKDLQNPGAFKSIPEEVIDAIETLGGEVEFNINKAVVMVSLRGTNVTGSGLLCLKWLTKLESLNLRGTNVTTTGLVHLKDLSGLKSLDLTDTKIADAGLVYLKGLTKLESLDLSSTKVTGAGLVHLNGLTHLFLGDTQLTDVGLVHLKGLTELQRLGLNYTKVTDAGLVHLKGLTKLEYLGLYKTKVTDVGLVHLKGLTKLEYLDLSSTKVTDAGLVHLHGLTELRYLDLAKTKVTDAGVKKLQQALPTCEIRH